MITLENKICAVLAHGKSLEELEKRIQHFKNSNVVWCGMNYFNPSEEIINKINKNFNIVFDCSTVKNNIEYEKNCRLPRLINYLTRPENNYYITLRTGKDNLYDLRNRINSNFNEIFRDKIIYGEDLGFNTNQFCVSLHLYLTCLFKLGTKKIVLFGADGDGSNNINTYYKPSLMSDDKHRADNVFYNMAGDTNNVNCTFNPIMQQIFGYIPEVLNCSPNSLYTVFKNISYEEVLNII